MKTKTVKQSIISLLFLSVILPDIGSQIVPQSPILASQSREETIIELANKAPIPHEASIRKIKDVMIYENPQFHCGFPAVVKRPDGEIFVAFLLSPDRRVFGETNPHIHVDCNAQTVMVRSFDGETWTKEPDLIYAYPFGDSGGSGLLQLRDGTLIGVAHSYTFIKPEGIANLKKPVIVSDPSILYGSAVFLGSYVIRSTDGGSSWKGPIYPPAIPAEVYCSPFGNTNASYGQLSEGVSGRIFWGVYTWHNEQGGIGSYLLTSDDKGLTWTYRCPIAVDEKVTFDETCVYETPKGDIVAFMRTARFNDYACIARSTDGGNSFGKWESMGFQGHPMNVLRLADNRVLLVYGYRHSPYGIRARILNAECTDFATSEEFVLRDDGHTTDLGYPWPVQLNDNRVLVAYYFHRHPDDTIHIAGTIIEIK